MKNNTPRFLIGKNIVAHPDGLYLVHTQYPRFIGRVWAEQGDVIRIGNILAEMQIEKGSRTNRLPSGEYYFMEMVDVIDDDPGYQWEKLMSRAGDWMFNYFKNMNHDQK
jgi:pSer/pThr/pTyr-binding forkhead associated (FHA) protein